MAKQIMVVDDSATMLMSVKSALEMNGYGVETASDGDEALSRLKSGARPDLIITDVNMPKMNGLELIRHVRSLPATRFTPILTLTTESDSAKRDEAKRLGATGWLVKPLGGNDLVKVLKQILPGS